MTNVQTLLFVEKKDTPFDPSLGKIVSEDFKLQLNILLQKKPEGSEI